MRASVRGLRRLGALILVAGLLSAGARAEASAFRVSYLEGAADMRGKRSWTPVKAGQALPEGAHLRTGPQGRLELTSQTGSVVRLGPSSRVRLARAQVGGGARRVGLRLFVGRLWANVTKSLAGDSSFEVRTTNAIAGVRGTSFTVLARKDASALIRVYTGTVGVRGRGKKKNDYASRKRVEVPGPSRVTKAEWEEVVAAAMTEVKVSAIGEISPAEAFEDEGDALKWAQWNRDRDADH